MSLLIRKGYLNMMDEKQKNKLKEQAADVKEQTADIKEQTVDIKETKGTKPDKPVLSKVDQNIKKLRKERALAKKKKKRDLINNIELAELMCEEESKEVFEEYKANFIFDHFCGEVKTVFVKEDLDCNKLTHDMLGTLRERLKVIDKKWHVGIITSTKRAYGGDDDLDDLDD